MSVMDKILAQQAELQAREESFGTFVRLPFFIPQNGLNEIRILPAWTMNPDDHFCDQFWREVGQHWRVNGKAPIICPKVTEKLKDEEIPCAICEFCDELAKDKSDLNAIKLLKEIKAKRAYLLPVIDVSDPEYTAKDVANFNGEECPFEAGDPKVQLYAAGATVWTQLVAAMATNKRSIADLATGRNVTIDKQYNTKNPLKTKYVVSMAFDPTEAEVPEGFKTPSIENSGWLKSYAEQLEFLAEGVGGDFPALVPGAVAPELPSGDTAPEEDAEPSNREVADEFDLNTAMQAALNEE